MTKFRMVAIVRADLNMPPGKMAVQVGHAFLQNYDEAHPNHKSDYMKNNQPKIVLLAPNLETLLKIKEKADKKAIYAELVTDAAKTFFKEPTVTVLCLGPLTKTDSNNLTRGLDMMD